MKTKIILTVFVSSFILHHSAFAQGALTPSGAPAPTMKSLDQIEARTAITNKASLVTISQPGSYYLTGNLTVSTGDGIDITTNGVTLDLNGFTIRSTAAPATGNGISLNGGLSDITLCNGHIRGGVTNNGSGIFSGSGFNFGIGYSGIYSSVNVFVLRISVSGCQGHGIILNSGVVEACTVRTVGGYGITATTVKTCTATDCGGVGIYGDQVVDCRGEHVGSGASSGISARIAQNCYGESSSSVGLSAITANNCIGYRINGTAIQATVANGCFAYQGTNNITYKYNMP